MQKQFQKIEEEGSCPNLFCEGKGIVLSKLDNDVTVDDNYRAIFLVDVDGKFL